MSLWSVIHNTDNGGDFKLLHSKHIVEAADENEAKAKSLALIDSVHKYTDVTRPRFLTSATPAPAGSLPTVDPNAVDPNAVEENDTEEEGK